MDGLLFSAPTVQAQLVSKWPVQVLDGVGWSRVSPSSYLPHCCSCLGRIAKQLSGFPVIHRCGAVYHRGIWHTDAIRRSTTADTQQVDRLVKNHLYSFNGHLTQNSHRLFCFLVKKQTNKRRLSLTLACFSMRTNSNRTKRILKKNVRSYFICDL